MTTTKPETAVSTSVSLSRAILVLGLGAVLLSGLPAHVSAQVPAAGATTLPDIAFAEAPAVRTLHVAQPGCATGNGACEDSEACGQTRPTACRSIGHAIAIGRAGDQVLVDWAPNPYAEEIYIDPGQSGSPSVPRVVRGITRPDGQKPRVVPSGDSSIVTVNSSYWVFDNLELDCRDLEMNGLYFITGDHSVARNVNVHNCGAAAIEVRNYADVLIDSAVLHDNQRYVSSWPWREDANGVTVNHGTKRVRVTR